MKTRNVNLQEQIPLASVVYGRAKLTKPNGTTLTLWVEQLVGEGVKLMKQQPKMKVQNFSMGVTPVNVSLSTRMACLESMPERANGFMCWCSHLVSIALSETVKG